MWNTYNTPMIPTKNIREGRAVEAFLLALNMKSCEDVIMYRLILYTDNKQRRQLKLPC